jgi:hypothetical protein
MSSVCDGFPMYQEYGATAQHNERRNQYELLPRRNCFRIVLCTTFLAHDLVSDEVPWLARARGAAVRGASSVDFLQLSRGHVAKTNVMLRRVERRYLLVATVNLPSSFASAIFQLFWSCPRSGQEAAIPEPRPLRFLACSSDCRRGRGERIIEPVVEVSQAQTIGS